MGRRVKKAVYAYGSGAWELQKEILFVYDGWNLIQEKEVSGTGDPLFDKFYVWGLDLSQSIQGAGGIGGLVCRVFGGEVRHYFYDANGNVGQMVNPADGAVSARYEYDPFGMAIVEDGTEAEGNAFRFSTKLFIGEIGGYDFGLRVYLPKLGRWTSRDPIGEQGGYNLYVFIRNTGINSIDPLGETDYRGYPVTDGDKNHIYLPRFKDQLSPEILITNIVIDAFNEILWITQNGTFRSEVDALLFATGTPMLSAEVKTAGQSAITVIDYSQSIVHKLYLFYKCGDDIVPIEGKIASEIVEDFAPKSGSVWGKNPLQRGIDIENLVAATDYKDWFRVGRLDNGKFPLVDFQKGNTLVSLKSVDPASKTAISRMQTHITDLSRGHTVSGNPASMVLDIRTPKGTESALQSLVKYGQQRGIQVRIQGF